MEVNNNADRFILLSAWKKIEPLMDPKGFGSHRKGDFPISDAIYHSLREHPVYSNFNLHSAIEKIATFSTSSSNEREMEKLSLKHQKWNLQRSDFDFVAKILFDTLTDYLTSKENKVLQDHWNIFVERFTMLEKKFKKASNGSLVVLCNGQSYNIHPFLESHPGGLEILLSYEGKDISKIMSSQHSENARTILELYKIE